MRQVQVTKLTLYQRVGQLLIRLYPAAWRERYGDEMLLILEDSSPTLLTLCNLLLSLFDAYIHYDLVRERKNPMLHKMRTNGLAIYSATLLFFAAWFLGQAHGLVFPHDQTLSSFFSFPSGYPLVSFVHLITYILLLSIILGGLPILLAACWRALRAGSWGTLFFCLMGLVSPLVTIVLAAFFIEARFFVMIAGLAVDLALIFFAVQRTAPSKRITSYALYLAGLIPLAMFTGLIVLLPQAISTFGMPGDDDFYVMREMLMFLIMAAMLVYALVALQKGFQAKHALQAPLRQETAMVMDHQEFDRGMR
jgi:hypothetical protein